MTTSPPSGTVTFLLTDLEGSTRRWEQDPDAMRPAMVRHDEILEKTIAARETHELLVAAVGEERARELRRTGAAMGLDEAVSFALANIDPKLLTGPIASIER
jgi:hypothetical protein